MKVFIESTSSLKKYLNTDEIALDDMESHDIDEIMGICRIPRGEVGFVTVNGKKESFGFTVKDGDIIKLFPMIVAG